MPNHIGVLLARVCLLSLVTLSVFLCQASGQVKIAWERVYEHGKIAFPESIIQTEDGGYLAAGWIGHQEGSSLISDMPYVLRVDNQGDLVWERTYPQNDSDVAESTCVISTGDGGFLVVGHSRLLDTGHYNIRLLKINGAGRLLWQKTHGILFEPHGVFEPDTWGSLKAYSVAPTGDGGFLIAGSAADVRRQVYVLKVDWSGENVWDRIYDAPSSWGEARSIIPAGDGGFLIVGQKGGHAYLSMIGSEGEVIWENMYGGPSLLSGVPTLDGGFVVAGQTYRDDPDSGEARSYLYMLKVNRQGGKVWEKTYRGWSGAGFYGSSAQAVMRSWDGGYVMTGRIWLGTGSHVYVLKTDSDGEKVWDIIHDRSKARVGCDIAPSCDGGFVVAAGALGEDSQSPWIYLIGINKLENRTVHNLTYFLEPNGIATVHHQVSVERTDERFNISITYPFSIPSKNLVVRSMQGAETRFSASYSPDNQTTTLVIEQYGSVGEIEVVFNLSWHRTGRRGNRFSVGRMVWDQYAVTTRISVLLPPRYVAVDWSPKENSWLTIETDLNRSRIWWKCLGQTEIGQGGECWVIFEKPRGSGSLWLILPSLAVILISLFVALRRIGQSKVKKRRQGRWGTGKQTRTE